MLFKFNFSSSFFQCFLQRFCFVFSQTFFQYTRCTIYHVLSLFQAQTTSFLHSLNDLKFSGTRTLQNYIKRSLLFYSSSTTSSRASSNCNSCSSRFNTIFFLQNRSKFINFFYCQVN